MPQYVSNRLAWPRFVGAMLLSTISLSAFSDESVNSDKSDYSLLDPTPDHQMRSFSTDRPAKANTPYTVDAGHLQYETDLTVLGYGNTQGTTTRDWTVVDPTLKVGVNNTIDAELQITPYKSVTTKTAAREMSLSGSGDTFGRLKINVVGDDQGTVTMAVLPYVKFPTARSGLGNGKLEGGIILPISFSVPGGFTVIIMPEGDFLKSTVGSAYYTAFDFLVNVSHPLDKRWSFYTEIFTSQYFGSHDSPVYTLDEALTYALTSNLQLDFGGNFGMNDVTPRIQLYAGLSQRF